MLTKTIDIYRIMLSDKKYGLSVNMMATRVMPSLLPQTVNPSLNLEQFMILLEVSWAKSERNIFKSNHELIKSSPFFIFLLNRFVDRHYKRCLIVLIVSNATSWNWTIYRFHHPNAIVRWDINSRLIICTSHHSTYPTFALIREKHQVRKTWRGKIPLVQYVSTPLLIRFAVPLWKLLSIY